MKINLILLAAGASKRFGSQKLLADFYGHPLYWYAFEAASSVMDLAQIIVVTGLAPLLEDAKQRGFLTAQPPKNQGLAVSISTGVTCSPPDTDFCFLVCDQPGITGEDLRKFLIGFRQSGCGLGRVYAGSCMGSPTAFCAVFRNELLSLSGDEGGKRLFSGREKDTFFCELPESHLVDYDTPWKYQ